jgi:hypothetical protein
MHTKDMLAEALRKCGLNEMADKAATGYYHDFLSPLDLPEMALVDDLAQASLGNNAKDMILKLREDVMNGKYDANKEESDDWARSPEGQAAFALLINTKK